MELGYDSRHDANIRKHYRHYLKVPLEESPYMDESPFTEIPIYRGSKLSDDNLLTRMLGKQEETSLDRKSVV